MSMQRRKVAKTRKGKNEEKGKWDVGIRMKRSPKTLNGHVSPYRIHAKVEYSVPFAISIVRRSLLLIFFAHPYDLRGFASNSIAEDSHPSSGNTPGRMCFQGNECRSLVQGPGVETVKLDFVMRL